MSVQATSLDTPMPAAEVIAAPATATNSLTAAKEWAELMSKLIPLIAGTVYLAGYVVTARRLAEYGVTVTQLLNAQYFAAGMAPGLMIWLTVAVAYSAVTSNQDTNKRRLNFAALLILGLIVGTILFIAINWLVGRVWGVWIQERWWFNSYVSGPALALLGLSTLWYIIAGFKTGLFIQMIRNRRQSEGFLGFLQGFGIMAFIGGSALVFTFLAAIRMYDSIPQAYGGGKPLNVVLYIERDKTPRDLIAVSTENNDKPVVRTITLRLVSQTADNLIVAAANESRTVWTLNAQTVHAITFNPELSPKTP